MDDKLTVTCYACSQPFTPHPIKVKVWADSGRPFDPTDWLCPTCSTEVAAYLDSLEAEDDPYDWRENQDLHRDFDDDRDFQRFIDDRDFDTNDSANQPDHYCYYCQSPLKYFDDDYLVCLNCSAQHELIFDPETQLWEAALRDDYDIWRTSLLKQQRTVADLEQELEEARRILENITAAEPKIPTTVHSVHTNEEGEAGTGFPPIGYLTLLDWTPVNSFRQEAR